VWAPLGSTTNWLSVSAVGAVVCIAWGYLAVTGSIETIWPLFGVSNQLLAVIALAVGTSFILRQRPAKYALVTFLPLCFLTVSTMTAGVLNTFRYLSPAYVADKGATVAYIDGALSVILIILVGMVLIDSARRWMYILSERRRGVVSVPAVSRDPDRPSAAPAAEVAG
ncbi:MAG TPA: carbon starvation CstA 5TM domain-containing protein, partial [Candidatus Angelobacter sp.]|nr:carbon starvation CstA 5TM domain-containing protein [Candidatus Angelobacter sp.]